MLIPAVVETRCAAVPPSFTYLASKFTCNASPPDAAKERSVVHTRCSCRRRRRRCHCCPCCPSHSLLARLALARPAPPRATNSSVRWGKKISRNGASERGRRSESPARGCARRRGDGTQTLREPFRGQQSVGRAVHSLHSSHRADNFPSFSLIYDDNQVSQERGRRRRKGRRGFLQPNSLLLNPSVRPSVHLCASSNFFVLSRGR